MAEPRKASLSGTVSWSSGELFTGFVLIGIALPSSSTYTYTRAALQNVYPPQRLPLWYRIPITNGQYDGTARIYWNIDIEPPNTRYVAWFYDVHNQLIGGPTAAFEVSSDSYTIPVPTLTVPSVSSTIPTPDTLPTDTTSTGVSYVMFIDNETPSGTINGTNATFLLGYAPNPTSSLQLYKNGQLLYSGVGYVLAGQTITFQAGYIPRAGDLLKANYRIFSSAVSGGSPTGIITNEVPAGAIDGSNTTYTLAFAPSPADSLMLYKNGQLLAPGIGYGLVGSTITITSEYTLVASDILRATYRF